ncbi:hypothetical protein [Nonomuraea sp. NPDC049695]|uniref:hypothetical protein n=1 Tax=Nonomuraea sp. NPDC049695 TaxID=3154734 RepID=UPI00341A482B
MGDDRAGKQPRRYQFWSRRERKDLDRGAGRRERERHDQVAPSEPSDEPDVLLDVPVVKVEEIHLEVNDLRARVSLSAEVLDLLRLNVGADVALGRVELDIKGVEAQALLKVRLHNVALILERVLQTIDDNPQILEHLTRGLGSAVRDVGGGAGRAVGDLGRGAGEAVEQVGVGAGGAVRDLGRGAGQAVEDVGHGAGEAVEEVGRGTGGAVEEVGRGTGGAVEEVGRETGAAVEDVGQEVGKTAGSVGDTAREVAGGHEREPADDRERVARRPAKRPVREGRPVRRRTEEEPEPEERPRRSRILRRRPDGGS